MKYQIRYQHTSYSSASSKAEALAAVRREARVTRLAIAEVADGTYCYRSKADKANDDTGTSAFAVICGPEQQND